MRRVSSRGIITPGGFVNEYHYGDFKGSPERWMATFFDAFVHVANWGTRWLMLRLPLALLSSTRLAPYRTPGEALTFRDDGDHVVLSFHANFEDHDWVNGEGWLATLTPLRSALLDGSQTWAGLVAQNDIALSLARLHYVSFWITPEALPKRYSTRFFAAEAPATATASACGGEVLDCRWLTARSALESAEEGSIKLHFPTRITLQALAEHASVRDMMRWARGCAQAFARIHSCLGDHSLHRCMVLFRSCY